MDSQTTASIGKRPFLLALLVLFSAACISSGCFITNCPPGGKRSSSVLGRVPVRQCASCGYGGRCFGPTICCSPAAGCLVTDGSSNSALLRPCAIEAVLPGACESGGKPCGTTTGGRCAARGICCDNVSCSTDSSCLVPTARLDSPYSEKAYGNSREVFPGLKTYGDSFGGLEGSVVNF